MGNYRTSDGGSDTALTPIADQPPNHLGSLPVDSARAQELLGTERSRIERELARLGVGPDNELSHSDQHPADEASELFEEERDQGLRERLQQELEAIGRAERRLAEGTYGLSVESGEPIPDGRLEAYPTAERTVEEQRRVERY